MGRPKTLAQQIADLEDPIPKDFDPEENAPSSIAEENSSAEENEADGTEHYVEVGKSKLRKQPEVALGPKYEGSQVSRQALKDEEHEPTTVYEDENESYELEDMDVDVDTDDGEIDSDEAFGESDVEKFESFTFRGSGKPRPVIESRNNRKSAADFMTDSEDEDVEDEESESGDGSNLEIESSGSGDEVDEAGSSEASQDAGNDVSSSGDDSEDSEEIDLHDNEASEDEEQGRRAELRKIMKEGENTIVATISQASKADADKGNAVKQQRKAFDSLLNVRIRLQKALVATNSMAAAEKDEKQSAALKEPYRAAEEAAIKLLDTLTGIRHDLSKSSTSAKAGTKRKRLEIDMPSSEIWRAIEASETEDSQTRLATLEKWSSKLRSATSVPLSRKLAPPSTQSLTSALQAHLSDPARLVARTRVPRSCAPLQASLKIPSDPNIFDDADFYQTLLKELVQQRMVDSSGGAADAVLPKWTAMKEVKARKTVDTKASKGRKMRYTVHEKLQNFMAPEDKGTWEQEAVERLFGSLLGRRLDLGEGAAEDEDGALGEEEALMLFRS